MKDSDPTLRCPGGELGRGCPRRMRSRWAGPGRSLDLEDTVRGAMVGQGWPWRWEISMAPSPRATHEDPPSPEPVLVGHGHRSCFFSP